MAKKSQQRPARQKKDTSGCMWGIISMFDFRFGRTPRRLLSNRRRYDNFTYGPPYSTSEADFSTDWQEMHPSIQDIEKANKPTFDLRRTRVNEVTEEKMFIDQDLKPRKSHERKNISKTLKKSFDEETLISHQAQKTSQYRDLEALVREILLIYRRRNGQHVDLGTGAKGSIPIVEEKLIAAIEALLNEKSRNGDRKKFHRSKEMFQMLTSNKEMFLKILQDQNSILLKEDEKSKSKSNCQESEEPLTHKHRKIYRRKSKSQETIPSYEKDRIVILKPGYSENRQSPGPRERAGKMVDSGWSSPNRDHFYMERFAKVPNGLKRANELKSENADNRISNIYVEAKKHLSEMLTSGDEDAESMKRSLPPLPRSLGRILSLREYNSYSPCTSPRGQPRPMVNKSQPIVTIENTEGKVAVPSDVTCEGDQETVKPSLYDIEHEKQPEECESRDSATEGRPSESLELHLLEKNEPSSSQHANEHSLATKTENHEIHHEKPSPTSILDPLFTDDDIIPARTVSPPVDVTVQPRCIQFDELVSSSENQQIRITDSGDNEESEFEYVEAVLLSSDLNWSGFETRWLSSLKILDPSLFNEVETFSGRAKHDQKLLFDSTNEALEDVCNRFIPESSFIKQNGGPVPKGMDLINEVWSRLESRLCKVHPRDLNTLVRNELETNRTWLDLQTGSREVVNEIEELMFDEVMDDVLFEFICC